MKIRSLHTKPPRVEMLPLIDVVFLLLVVFIYTMLSMAVHKGLPVALPISSQAQSAREKPSVVSITVRADGRVYLDKQLVPIEELTTILKAHADHNDQTGVLLFADRQLPYQSLFHVLDKIRQAGLSRINLQAESEEQP
jgi:biopolymer transport protein ExbD